MMPSNFIRIFLKLSMNILKNKDINRSLIPDGIAMYYENKFHLFSFVYCLLYYKTFILIIYIYLKCF